MSRFANGELQYDEFRNVSIDYEAESDYSTNPHDVLFRDPTKPPPLPTFTKTLDEMQAELCAHYARQAAAVQHAAQVDKMVWDIIHWKPIPLSLENLKIWGAAAARVRREHWAEREERGIKFMVQRMEEWGELMGREGLMGMRSLDGERRILDVGEEKVKRAKMRVGFALVD